MDYLKTIREAKLDLQRYYERIEDDKELCKAAGHEDQVTAKEIVMKRIGNTIFELGSLAKEISQSQ